jgi:hypothetical protein
VRNFEQVLASTGSATSSLPRYIFANLDTLLAGESQLGFHNEAPPPRINTDGSGKAAPGVAPGS